MEKIELDLLGGGKSDKDTGSSFKAFSLKIDSFMLLSGNC